MRTCDEAKWSFTFPACVWRFPVLLLPPPEEKHLPRSLLLWCFFSFQITWYAEELPFKAKLLLWCRFNVLNRHQLIRADHSDWSALNQSSKRNRSMWTDDDGKTQRRQHFQLFRSADKQQYVKVLRAPVLWENRKQGFFVYAALYGAGLVNAVGWISCFPFMNEV